MDLDADAADAAAAAAALVVFTIWIEYVHDSCAYFVHKKWVNKPDSLVVLTTCFALIHL